MKLVCMSALALQASALVAPVAPGVQMSQISCSRVADPTMFVGGGKSTPKPKAAPKAAPKRSAPAAKKVVKKAPAKKASGGSTGFAQQGSAKGKGGFFPWVVNEPGTYAEVPMLSGLFADKKDPKGSTKGMFGRKM